MSELRGYDAWKTTEPEDRYPSPPVSYHCLDCSWRGTQLASWDHHRGEHHRIALQNGQLAIFRCCNHELNDMALRVDPLPPTERP